jgi:hypothetical protein
MYLDLSVTISAVAVEGLEPIVRSRLTNGPEAGLAQPVVASPEAPRRAREKLSHVRVEKPRVGISLEGKLPPWHRPVRVDRTGIEPVFVRVGLIGQDV